MFDIKKEQCGDEYRYTITIDLGFEKITGTSDNLGGAVRFLSSNIDGLLWCYFNNFSTIKRTYLPVDLPRLKNYIEGVGNQKFHPNSDIKFIFSNPFDDEIILSLYTDGIDKIMDEFSVNHELIGIRKEIVSTTKDKVFLEAEYRLDAEEEDESPYSTHISWNVGDSNISVFADNTCCLMPKLNERLCMLVLEEMGEKCL